MVAHVEQDDALRAALPADLYCHRAITYAAAAGGRQSWLVAARKRAHEQRGGARAGAQRQLQEEQHAQHAVAGPLLEGPAHKHIPHACAVLA